eukprot:CAMPEP_0182438426 /NCGR_PEP_ID=MMETSP1167-20130531/85765_1 /TAXON_ID=2988 /ORGANISM="Mallomonas Sp, Strain CCMP3275" /LENGTH=1237 /DNA_ID=CAMNT_0024631793 /DNA_START=216 /DNA_END=3929 /DNA_ORIENTATION=-
MDFPHDSHPSMNENHDEDMYDCAANESEIERFQAHETTDNYQDGYSNDYDLQRTMDQPVSYPSTPNTANNGPNVKPTRVGGTPTGGNPWLECMPIRNGCGTDEYQESFDCDFPSGTPVRDGYSHPSQAHTMDVHSEAVERDVMGPEESMHSTLSFGTRADAIVLYHNGAGVCNPLVGAQYGASTHSKYSLSHGGTTGDNQEEDNRSVDTRNTNSAPPTFQHPEYPQYSQPGPGAHQQEYQFEHNPQQYQQQNLQQTQQRQQSRSPTLVTDSQQEFPSRADALGYYLNVDNSSIRDPPNPEMQHESGSFSDAPYTHQSAGMSQHPHTGQKQGRVIYPTHQNAPTLSGDAIRRRGDVSDPASQSQGSSLSTRWGNSQNHSQGTTRGSTEDAIQVHSHPQRSYVNPKESHGNSQQQILHDLAGLPQGMHGEANGSHLESSSDTSYGTRRVNHQGPRRPVQHYPHHSQSHQRTLSNPDDIPRVFDAADEQVLQFVESGVDSHGNYILHSRCKTGHLLSVIRLCEFGFDPSIADQFGRTPLHIACEKGHIHIAKYLLNVHNVDVLSVNKEGFTALHFALRGCFVELAFLLMEKSPDLANISTANKCSPLMIACKAGSLQLVTFLIEEHGVDTNVKDTHGVNCLSYAAMEGHMDVILYLCQLPVSRRPDIRSTCNFGYTCLHFACGRNDPRVVEYLLKQTSVDPNVRETNGLLAVELSTNQAVFDVWNSVISASTAISATSEPLNRANREVVNVSSPVQAHVDKEAQQRPPVPRVDPNAFAICFARVQAGDVPGLVHEIVKLHVNTIMDDEGRSLLHKACIEGHFEMVRYLSEVGEADFSLIDNYGSTALFYATQKGHIKIVEYMKNRSDAGRRQNHQAKHEGTDQQTSQQPWSPQHNSQNSDSSRPSERKIKVISPMSLQYERSMQDRDDLSKDKGLDKHFHISNPLRHDDQNKKETESTMRRISHDIVASEEKNQKHTADKFDAERRAALEKEVEQKRREEERVRRSMHEKALEDGLANEKALYEQIRMNEEYASQLQRESVIEENVTGKWSRERERERERESTPEIIVQSTTPDPNNQNTNNNTYQPSSNFSEDTYSEYVDRVDSVTIPQDKPDSYSTEMSLENVSKEAVDGTFERATDYEREIVSSSTALDRTLDVVADSNIGSLSSFNAVRTGVNETSDHSIISPRSDTNKDATVNSSDVTASPSDLISASGLARNRAMEAMRRHQERMKKRMEQNNK